MPGAGSLFDPVELARWRASSRPLARPESPRVTIACGCGVVMEVTWLRASPVRCFGCGRAFDAPPSVDERPFEWRPERAAVPPELAGEPFVEARPPRGRRLARALAPVVAGLVVLLVLLGVRARTAPAAGERAPDVPLKTEETSDDR